MAGTPPALPACAPSCSKGVLPAYSAVERAIMSQIRVECYAGYRGEQEPRVLVIDGRRLSVEAITFRSIEPTGRRFRVRCEDGRQYDLFHEEATGDWRRA